MKNPHGDSLVCKPIIKYICTGIEWRYAAEIDNAVPRNGSINENLKAKYEIFMMREINMNRMGNLLLAYQSPQ